MYYNYIDNGVNCIKKIIHGTWTNKNTKLEKGYAAYKRDDDELNQDLKKIYHTRSFEETVYEPNVEYLNKITFFMQGEKCSAYSCYNTIIQSNRLPL